jgi:hypothetical protein
MYLLEGAASSSAIDVFHCLDTAWLRRRTTKTGGGRRKRRRRRGALLRVRALPGRPSAAEAGPLRELRFFAVRVHRGGWDLGIELFLMKKIY